MITTERSSEPVNVGNAFVMYHATLISRITSITKYGLIPRPAPHRTLWSPKENIIYLTNSVDIARDYANQAFAMRKTDARAWIIFKVKYDEFPGELYQDLDWGLPGTYYVKIRILPEHLEFVERYMIIAKPRNLFSKRKG